MASSGFNAVHRPSVRFHIVWAVFEWASRFIRRLLRFRADLSLRARSCICTLSWTADELPAISLAGDIPGAPGTGCALSLNTPGADGAELPPPDGGAVSPETTGVAEMPGVEEAAAPGVPIDDVCIVLVSWALTLVWPLVADPTPLGGGETPGSAYGALLGETEPSACTDEPAAPVIEPDAPCSKKDVDAPVET
jgi:hypothetical protein